MLSLLLLFLLLVFLDDDGEEDDDDDMIAVVEELGGIKGAIRCRCCRLAIVCKGPDVVGESMGDKYAACAKYASFRGMTPTKATMPIRRSHEQEQERELVLIYERGRDNAFDALVCIFVAVTMPKRRT